MTRTGMIIRGCVLFFALTVWFGALPASAQAKFWIQVESQNNIRDTRARAQFFAARFPETHAFQTTSRWNAIALGPYSRTEADALTASLKSQGLIPPDSVVSDGASFRGQMWPLAASTDAPANVGEVVITDPATAPAALDQTATQTTDDAATASVPETPVAPTEPDTQSPVATTTDATQIATDTKQPGSASETEVVAAEPAKPDPNNPLPDPDLRATRALERTWTRDQKMEYQTYMVWTGDYTSGIDGSYGRGTRKAIKAFQAREGYEATGYLTEAQVLLLKKRYDDKVAFLGIETLSNTDAGVEMKFPANLVTFDKFDPPFVRFKPKSDSKVKMMLISQQGGRDVLKSLYDIMETFDYIPPDGYRVRKRTWFVLSGRNDKVVSYTYAKTTANTVKGFTLIWPPAMDDVMQPLAEQMYNSFTTLDSYVLDETLGYGQGDDQPVDLTTGIDTATPQSAATGFVVSKDGVIVTNSANIETCKRVTIGDTVDLDLIARNRQMELAVLKPASAYTPRSFALFSDEKPQLGAEVTVAGFSFPQVMDVATLNYGTLTAMTGRGGDETSLRVSAFLETGDTGGPVLDDRGAVIGMRLARSDQETGLPEYVNFALRAEPIMALLDRHNLTYGRAKSFDSVAPEDLAYMAGDFTVKVSCWK